jgi:hypothetical protein
MTMRLVKADVAVCPECGGLVEYKTLGRVGNYYVCIDAACLHHCIHPDWAARVPDVEGVVDMLRRFAGNTEWEFDDGTPADLRGWADELEGGR